MRIGGNMKKLFKILVVLGIVIFGLYSCSKSIIKGKFISTVKDGYFSEINEDVTIGKMMSTICKNCKWDYATTDAGTVFVTFRGTRNGYPMELDFFVRNFMGEMVFQVNRFRTNNVELTGKEADVGAPMVIYNTYLKDTGNKSK